MRHFAALALLTACSTLPVGPPVAIPTLVIDYEPSERFLAPRKSPEEVPVAQLVATVEGAAKPAGAVALDTHTEAVLADRGAPFRAASELLSGWFLLPPGQQRASHQHPVDWVSDDAAVAAAGALEVVQEAGDVLVVPPMWAAAALNTRDSVSVATRTSQCQ